MAKSPIVPKNVDPKALQPAAPAARKASADRNAAPPVPVATKVFIHAVSSGPRGALAAVPLHEIPLLRRKLQAFGESLTLVGEWPKNHPRERPLMRADLEDEYKRLQEAYVFTPPDSSDKVDLVADFFGPFQGGRHLIEVLSLLNSEWQKLAAHCLDEERDPTSDEMADVLAAADPQMIQSDTIDVDA